MTKTSKWKMNDMLSNASNPSLHCQVRELEVAPDGTRHYVVSIAGEPDYRKYPADELETYWARSKPFQKKDAAEQADPPEPPDDDFDEDGMPIYKPEGV